MSSNDKKEVIEILKKELRQARSGIASFEKREAKNKMMYEVTGDEYYQKEMESSIHTRAIIQEQVYRCEKNIAKLYKK